LNQGDVVKSHALIRLMQLVSPALPVGSYAYSTGLEQAVDLRWVHNEATTGQWIEGVFQHSLGRLDLPVLKRLYDAQVRGDPDGVLRWSEFLFASRESAELQLEDEQLGAALARLACDLDIAGGAKWRHRDGVPLATVFSLVCHQWEIPLMEAALGYGWMWCENQVAAAIKLIPLGQTSGQRILGALAEELPAWVEVALELGDDEIGAVLPGMVIASGMHETQYCRLFRS
jgi:urease accessory protein